MKTNKEKNTEYDSRVQDKVRPSQPVYDFETLGAVIRQWIIGSK